MPADLLIGPVFLHQVEDWPAHLALLKSFWSTVLRGEKAEVLIARSERIAETLQRGIAAQRGMAGERGN